MVAYTLNSSIWDVKARGSGIQGLQLLIKFLATLGYKRPYFKQQQYQQWQQQQQKPRFH